MMPPLPPAGGENERVVTPRGRFRGFASFSAMEKEEEKKTFN